MGTWVRILVVHVGSQIRQCVPMAYVLETGRSWELTGLSVCSINERLDPWEILSPKRRRRVQGWAECPCLPRSALFAWPLQKSPSFPWQLSNSTCWASLLSTTETITCQGWPLPHISEVLSSGNRTSTRPLPCLNWGLLSTVFLNIMSIEWCFPGGGVAFIRNTKMKDFIYRILKINNKVLQYEVQFNVKAAMVQSV